MEISDTLLHKIEQYFSGNLPLDEYQDFAKEIENDPQLAAEIERFKQARQAIDVSSEAALKEQLKKRYYDTPSRKIVRIPWLAVAASVCLLIAASIWIFYPEESQQFSSEELAEMYYSPDFAIAQRGETLPSLEAVEKAYAMGDYQQVIDLIGNVEPGDVGDRLPYMYMMLGSSYLAITKPEEAVKAFDQIQEGSAYHWKAKWYKVLALLAMNEAELARPLLDDLKESKEFGEDAQFILTQIKE